MKSVPLIGEEIPDLGQFVFVHQYDNVQVTVYPARAKASRLHPNFRNRRPHIHFQRSRPHSRQLRPEALYGYLSPSAHANIFVALLWDGIPPNGDWHWDMLGAHGDPVAKGHHLME